MKLGANYQRIGCVFDRYFEKSLKECTRSGRGEGSQYPFERDSTTIPFQKSESFLSNSDNKDKLNKYLGRKLLELYQNEQMLVVTYENTSFTSKPTCTELDQYIPVRPCGAEEVDQRLVRHALNLLRNGYKSILICTIDTDVLNLLISYFSQFELDDVNMYAYMIN